MCLLVCFSSKRACSQARRQPRGRSPQDKQLWADLPRSTSVSLRQQVCCPALAGLVVCPGPTGKSPVSASGTGSGSGSHGAGAHCDSVRGAVCGHGAQVCDGQRQGRRGQDQPGRVAGRQVCSRRAQHTGRVHRPRAQPVRLAGPGARSPGPSAARACGALLLVTRQERCAPGRTGSGWPVASCVCPGRM